MRKASVVLAEMIDAIAAARECCAGLTPEEFKHNRMARLATERAIEILSEAARHMPDEITARHPDIPWRKVRAIGNVLRHEYHRISSRIVWDVVTCELDALDVVLREELLLIGPEGQ